MAGTDQDGADLGGTGRGGGPSRARADLPEGMTLRRVTDEFTPATVPAGLLRAHRIAEGVWGLLRVRAGSVLFVEETDPEWSVRLGAGDAQVITPGVPHRVEPDGEARFVVEFHR